MLKIAQYFNIRYNRYQDFLRNLYIAIQNNTNEVTHEVISKMSATYGCRQRKCSWKRLKLFLQNSEARLEDENNHIKLQMAEKNAINPNIM
jgi:hypothetical protein